MGLLVDENTSEIGFIDDKGPGFYILPFGVFEFEEYIKGWRFYGNLDLNSGGVKITESGISPFNEEEELVDAEIVLTIRKFLPDEAVDQLILGAVDGTRIEMSWPFLVVKLIGSESSFDFFIQSHFCLLYTSPSPRD